MNRNHPTNDPDRAINFKQQSIRHFGYWGELVPALITPPKNKIFADLLMVTNLKNLSTAASQP